MAKSVVGVDIGTESVRGVEVVNARGPRPTVVRFHEIPMPEGAVRNGEVVEANTVAATLKQLWSAAGFKSRNVVLGVGNPKVLVRDLTVPRLGLKDIRAALPFQVQDILPVPVTDALLDFYPVSESETEQGPVVHGLLVAGVKESISQNVLAAQLAGLTPVGMDIIPFALNRVVSRSQHRAGTSAVIDVGAATTNVVIVSDGVPQFVRIVPAGGHDVTKTLVGRLNISPEQAELGKRHLGFAPSVVAPEHEEAAQIVRDITGDLLNSLRNTLSFYVNSRQAPRIDRILLSGGGSEIARFAEALSEMTRIPVVTESPLAAVGVAKGAVRSERTRESQMTVALGLALGSAA